MESTRRPRLSYTHVTGFFPMHRSRQSVHFASPLERDFLLWVDFELDVKSVTHEPVTLRNDTANKAWRQYTPDYLVEFAPAAKRRPLLVEVKPRDVLERDWPIWRLKFKAAFKHARENDWTFKIFHENAIRTPELPARQFLRRYLTTEPPQDDVARLLSAIPTQPITLHAWFSAAGYAQEQHPEIMTHAWHLVATRQVKFDMLSEMNRNLLVSRL